MFELGPKIINKQLFPAILSISTKTICLFNHYLFSQDTYIDLYKFFNMRFINIVLLQLFAVAGSTFALAPKLILEVDGWVDQNPGPITGNCLHE
jgi:hypothetical protein